jgi:hypothetical protein
VHGISPCGALVVLGEVGGEARDASRARELELPACNGRISELGEV